MKSKNFNVLHDPVKLILLTILVLSIATIEVVVVILGNFFLS